MSDSKVDETKNRLAVALLEKGMKPVDLANATGLSKASISMYLSGERIPKQNNIYLMAKILNVSEPWLMGYDVPKNKEYSPDISKIIELLENNPTLRRLLAYAMLLPKQRLNNLASIAEMYAEDKHEE